MRASPRSPTAYPYWFSPDYGAYAGREADIPVDQHQLDRPDGTAAQLLIGGAWRDQWSDPGGSFRAAHGRHAGLRALWFGRAGAGGGWGRFSRTRDLAVFHASRAARGECGRLAPFPWPSSMRISPPGTRIRSRSHGPDKCPSGWCAANSARRAFSSRRSASARAWACECPAAALAAKPRPGTWPRATGVQGGIGCHIRTGGGRIAPCFGIGCGLHFLCHQGIHLGDLGFKLRTGHG